MKEKWKNISKNRKQKTKTKNQNPKILQTSFVVVQQVTNQELPALYGQKSSPGKFLIYLLAGSWPY
jgi:hypothetical protein